MMRYLVLGLLLPASLYAQEWTNLGSRSDAGFNDIIEAYESVYGNEFQPEGAAWKHYNRWKWYMSHRVDANGEIPNRRFLYAETRRARLQQQYKGASGNWEPMGPFYEDQGTPNVNFPTGGIGRLSAVAFHPTDTNIMWVGAPSGGIWKTTDGANSWTDLASDLPHLGVAGIAVHPNNPDILYIGTGDPSFTDAYTYGVMKSEDGGQTWDTTGLSFSVAQNFRITKLLIDTASPSVLIASSTDGIYRTEDGGDTWVETLAGTYADLEFKPFDSSVMYACTENDVDLNQRFYRSTDNGETWQESTAGMNTAEMRRCKVAVTPAAPEHVYVVAASESGGLQSIMKSIDSGQTWFEILGDSLNYLGFNLNSSFGQGWFSMDLAVSPTDTNDMWLGGIFLWRTQDGGATINMAGDPYGASAPVIHADFHVLQYHPSTGSFLLGNDGGLYTYDPNTGEFDFKSNGMDITQLYRVGNAVTELDMFMVGAQDNGTRLHRNNTWQTIRSGDGMECLISHEDPDVLYFMYQGGQLQQSTDGGLTVQSITPQNFGVWVSGLAMNPKDAQVLYAVWGAPESGAEIHRSNNGGMAWEMVGAFTGMSSVTTSETFVRVSEQDTSYAVAGGSNRLRLTTNSGEDWDYIYSGLPQALITDVTFDPLDENTLWVTYGGYDSQAKVFRTQNEGEDWEDMSMNLPALPINCIALDKSTSGGVYIGTDVGVYYWDSSLTEWEPFVTGLPNVIVTDLEFHHSTNTLRAATYGRGTWQSDGRNLDQVSIEESSQHRPLKVWPNPAKDQMFVRLNDDLDVSTLQVIDACGRPVGVSANKVNSNLSSFQVMDLPAGMYYIRNVGGVLAARFIVAKD